MKGNINMPKTVPILPGMQFTDPYKTNFHKTQQFALVNGVNREKEKFTAEEPDYDLISSMKYSGAPNLTYGSKPEPVNEHIPRIPPSWLKYDK